MNALPDGPSDNSGDPASRDEPGPRQPGSATLRVNAEGIPTELTRLGQWVVWRQELRKGKPTKVPYNAKTGRCASSTDPKTWTTFEEALACYRGSSGRYAGVGFVFASDDPFFGLDLDACRNRETGELTPWAQEVLDDFPTYVEVSPSGYGIKLVARGKLPAGSKKVKKLAGVPTFGVKAPEIAVFDCGRFWCLTGQRLAGSPPKCYGSASQPRKKGVGNARTTKLDELNLEPGRTFGYWFDFGDDWYHQLEVERIEHAIPTVTYPRIIGRVGKSPPQYAGE